MVYQPGKARPDGAVHIMDMGGGGEQSNGRTPLSGSTNQSNMPGMIAWVRRSPLTLNEFALIIDLVGTAAVLTVLALEVLG